MVASLVEVEHLAKSYTPGNPVKRLFGRAAAPRIVLRDVTFTVDSGPALALLGSNGAGKTTILKTLSTLLVPDSGTVRVCGNDVVRNGSRVRGVVSLCACR
jgi:ABC-2 type transport system ATP-binding protein